MGVRMLLTTTFARSPRRCSAIALKPISTRTRKVSRPINSLNACFNPFPKSRRPIPVEPSQKYFDPRTLAKLQGLRLRAHHIVEGFVAGLHRSPLKGFSIEFAEHREYVAGDDLRYVDWRLYGRTDKLYLKQFEDETNLVCCVTLDSSESMRYQGPDSPLSKYDYAACAAAALAWLVMQQQDAVAIGTFDSQLRTFVRPSGNPTQIQQLVHVLESTDQRGKTSAAAAFHELAERLVKRSVVAIFSDLFDDVPNLLAGLKHLHHRRHDVILFHVLDANELEFAFQGTTKFRGLESLGEVVTDPGALRRAYLDELDQFLVKVRRGCREFGIDYVLMRTDQPLDAGLSHFLARRMAKVK